MSDVTSAELAGSPHHLQNGGAHDSATSPATGLAGDSTELAAIADLARSGISPSQAAAAGIAFTSNAQEADLSLARAPALLIPYFEPRSGQPMTWGPQRRPFLRVRYLAEVKARDGKIARYGQPHQSGVRAYFPAVIAWSQVLDDRRQPLLVVEGEKKALAACKFDMPCIALGGVWNFSEGGALLSDLRDVDWNQRPVALVYDSDAATNESVQHARRRLAFELQRLGATVFLPALPASPDNRKQGLDDFLLSLGKDAFLALLCATPAERTPEAGALLLREWIDEVNARYAVVRHGGDALVATIDRDAESGLERISFMKVEAFQTLYRNKFPADAAERGKRSHVGKLWLDSPQRREFPDGVIFAPGRDTPSTVLNLYRGWRLHPAAGDWSKLRDHIRQNICRDDPAAFNYVMGWLSSSVRSLDRPLGVALVLRGGQGTGKGFLGRALGHLFGAHFLHLTKSDHAVGRFNAAMGNALLVFADEAFYAGDPRQTGSLKALVTEPQITIEAKFRDPVMRANTVRLLLATNEEWAVPADVDDRRFAVFDVADERRNDRTYFAAIQGQLEAGGYAAMLHDLLAMDVGGFDITDIPDTKARADQKLSSLKGPLAWLLDVLQCGEVRTADGMSGQQWNPAGLAIPKDQAYRSYVAFSKERREYSPAVEAQWARQIKATLGATLGEDRPRAGHGRQRRLVFGPISECRTAFARHVGTSTISWEDHDA